MRQALTERRDLIEQRADAVLDEAVSAGETWVSGLGATPTDPAKLPRWRRVARTVAAYRDRYQITSDTVLGAPPDDTNQRIDYARAEAAIRSIETLHRPRQAKEPVRAASRAVPSL